MTTYESAISIMRQLPEEDLKIINELAMHLLSKRRRDNVFQPLTQEEWLAKLDASRLHASVGKIHAASEVSNTLREKYNLT